MKQSKIENNITEYYIIMLIFFLLFENYSEQANHYIERFVFPLGAVFTGLIIWKLRMSVGAALIWGYFLLLGVINIYVVRNLGWFYLTRTLFVHFPIALFLVQKKLFASYGWKCLTWSGLLFITWIWSKAHGIQFFYQSSRNYVSIYVLFIMTIYAIYLDQRDKELPVQYFVYMFVMSVWAVGRGGIVTSGIMLFLYVCYTLFNSKKNFWYFVPVVALGVAFVYFVMFTDVEVYFSRFTDHSSVSSDKVRFNLVTYYIQAAQQNYQNILLGANMSDISNLVTKNLHNSYVQIHSFYGLLGLVAVVCFGFNSINYLIKTRKFVLLILFIGVLIRATTDFMFISGFSDILLFYYMLLPFRVKQRSVEV